MSSIKLSICIPTYNRASYIGSAIESVVSQARDDVEIVISDNASTDNTEIIVRGYIATHQNIRYHRSVKNMGADRNYLKTIEMAVGEYCWFLGSDDRIEKNGINTVIRAIEGNKGLSGISVNYFAYDVEMKNKLIPVSPPGDGALDKDTLFNDAGEVCNILGGYFGYLSGHIVNRKMWNNVVAKGTVEKYLNAYVHVYVMFCMLLENPKWLYLHGHCVGWRVGNDSFLDEGLFKRLLIDVIGYEVIARDTFGKNSKAYKGLNKKIANIHTYNAIKSANHSAAGVEFYLRAFVLCLKYYWKYPSFWVKSLPWFFVFPGYLIRLINYIRSKGLIASIEKIRITLLKK